MFFDKSPSLDSAAEEATHVLQEWPKSVSLLISINLAFSNSCHLSRHVWQPDLGFSSPSTRAGDER
eukprot:1152426-Pelagomonas_calceolata.AAC.2